VIRIGPNRQHVGTRVIESYGRVKGRQENSQTTSGRLACRNHAICVTWHETTRFCFRVPAKNPCKILAYHVGERDSIWEEDSHILVESYKISRLWKFGSVIRTSGSGWLFRFSRSRVLRNCRCQSSRRVDIARCRCYLKVAKRANRQRRRGACQIFVDRPSRKILSKRTKKGEKRERTAVRQRIKRTSFL